MAARGCGVREPGGIYFVCPLTAKGGSPVEDFLFDPPLPLGGLQVPNRGVLILERGDGSGIHDVYDKVGKESYPNVADMVEEIRHMGLSRRASKGLDFSLLGPGSLIYLVHERAIVDNAGAIYRALHNQAMETPDAVAPWLCKCGRIEHESLPYYAWHEDCDDEGLDEPTCASLWWELLIKADPVYDLDAPRRSCTRKVGSTSYAGRSPVGLDVEPDWVPGIFARFPIKRLEVVADPDGGQDDVAYERLDSARLPIREVEE